jgi:hypothetical protein
MKWTQIWASIVYFWNEFSYCDQFPWRSGYVLHYALFYLNEPTIRSFDRRRDPWYIALYIHVWDDGLFSRENKYHESLIQTLKMYSIPIVKK